jgi:hypothetical protein
LKSSGLLHLLLPNAHLLKNPLEKLPETIHQFWERFGYPNDHKIGRNTEVRISAMTGQKKSDLPMSSFEDGLQLQWSYKCAQLAASVYKCPDKFEYFLYTNPK